MSFRSVTQVSIDTNGEFIASCSDDGNIALYSLYASDSQPVLTNYKRPVKAVALEPDYSKKSSRLFASGGMAEALNLSGKGWFGNSNAVIHSGEGPVYTIQWHRNYMAWANDAGVRIYDTAAQQKFAFVAHNTAEYPRPDLFRCNLCWQSGLENSILFIGWANSVRIGRVIDRSKMDVASGLPQKSFEIIVLSLTYSYQSIVSIQDGLCRLWDRSVRY